MNLITYKNCLSISIHEISKNLFKMTFPPDLADNHRPIKNTVPSGKMINKNDDKKGPNMLDQWNI